MNEQRHRHATVAQLLTILAELLPDDVICTDLPPTGNLPVFRGGAQVAVIEMSPQDLVHQPAPIWAKIEWLI